MERDLKEFFYDPDEEGLDLPVPAPPTPPAAVEAGTRDIVELLSFRLAGEEYAVEIGSVREIVKPPPITEVPRAPEAVLGVIGLRGEALPVFDPLLLLGLARHEEASSVSRRVIVIDTEQGLAGLSVDAVEHVVRMPRQAIEPPPAGLAGPMAGGAIKGIGRVSGRLLAILDPLELLMGSHSS